MSSSPQLRFSTVLGARLWRDLLQGAAATAKHFTLVFTEVSPIHRAFAPMAREQKFDLCEMAIVTALQALAYDKPLILLPITVASRFQHRCLITMRSERPVRPGDLVGRSVGVRAYTQTTGVWLRGILQNDYGVAPESVRWVTQEGAHVAEYRDPTWVERAPDGPSLPELLRRGEIDAAILGNDLPDDPDFVPVIAQPDEAARGWFEKYGVVPVNHMLMIRKDLAEQHRVAVRELWQTLKRVAPAGSLIGIEAHRPALELLLDYCRQQRLFPKQLRIEDVFAPTHAILDDL